MRPLPKFTYRLINLLVFLFFLYAKGQHTNEVFAQLDGESREIQVQQKYLYVNTSDTSLNSIWFYDWNNSYSSKRTPLSKRFAEEFNRSLHLARQKDRGFTTMISIVAENYQGLEWEYGETMDLLEVKLPHTLKAGDSIKIHLTYTLKLPDARFSGYGYRNDGGVYLKDWYLSPLVYRDGWLKYSNKNLDDLYTEKTERSQVQLVYPKTLFLSSNYKEVSSAEFPQGKQVVLEEQGVLSCEVFLMPQQNFTTHIAPNLKVVSDIEARKYNSPEQGASIIRIADFLEKHLGTYPHEHLLVSEQDYNRYPLYGINQLPSFVRPYDARFQYEMKFLKTALRTYLRESLFLDPRADKWVLDGVTNYLMIRFVEEYYPDQKWLGKLSKVWGVRSFNLAQMGFNDQYNLLHMLSVRSNLDQSLTTPNDSLIKLNQKIASGYKAGLGLAYIADYIGKEQVESAIQNFVRDRKGLPGTTASDFETALRATTDKELDWFFTEYVQTRKKIDYRIKKVVQDEDSIEVTLKNKRGTAVPISLFGLQGDSVVSKYWFSGFDSIERFRIPKNGEERLVLNYNKVIPEFNQRDNWKSLGGFFSSNKKIKFQFFKDTENPYYHQVFYVPIANYNIYDGITPGIRLYNKTFLERQFRFDIAPTYSFLERTLVGGGGFQYRKYHGKSGLFVSNYSLGGGTSHFQTNSRYTTITPSVSFGWRPGDLISNKRQFLNVRWRNVFRNIDPAIADQIDTDPDYSVFNVRYINRDNDIINFKNTELDFQYAQDFVKISFEWEFRRLFQNNRQINLRFFAGKFLKNDTNSDFFSFALDRPTDYLFDLDYLGRSEATGLVSQQIIIAEGGFKSRFDDAFANDWLATVNGSFNLWRWIELYGDLGLAHDNPGNTDFLYDSGLRLNLVTDYFELYFPLYSNLGWEIAQPDYGTRIRFVITVSPKTLTGLFTRKWF